MAPQRGPRGSPLNGTVGRLRGLLALRSLAPALPKLEGVVVRRYPHVHRPCALIWAPVYPYGAGCMKGMSPRFEGILVGGLNVVHG